MTSNRSFRGRFFRLAACLVLLLCLHPLIAGAQPADASKRDGVWAQNYAGRPADPAVRFGQLDNGMRYAIQHNATPASHTSLRLLIRSGSLSERDDQRGLAHFLEHMAFRGSTHVPAGDMVRILQRLGLTFGADTNAHTSLDETVYQFDLPRSDADITGTGLMLLREIAGELTLAQSEMDPERGVVLSEERVRDGPDYRRGVAELAFQMEGQLPPRRMPIGQTDILRNAPVSLIRDFYEAEYRPDNATIVAVGDFDVDAMEAAIRARFADWTAKAAKPPKPELGPVLPRGATARTLTAPGTPNGLSLAWVAPYDNAADTLAREQRDVAESLAAGVLRNRLETRAQSADAPFLSVSAGRSGAFRAATITVMNMQPKPGAWKPALETAIEAQRRLATYGIRPDEHERATSEFMTGIRVAAEGAPTRQSNRIADDIVRAASSDDVYTSPAQDLAEATAILEKLDLTEIDSAAKRLFTGSGPLLFLAGPDPIPGGDAAVTAALAEAISRPIENGKAEAVKTWPYAPSPPGAIATRTTIADLDVTSVRFANNVRLLAKHTDFARDEVLVLVRIGSGRLGIAPENAKATWMVSGTIPILTAGGTRELTREDIQKLTSANRIDIRQSLDDDAFVLTGTTRPADLDRQLELLQATTTQPGLRQVAFDRIKASLTNQLPQLEASASGVFSRAAPPALHGGDLRWQRIPDAASLATASLDDLAALIKRDFAEGPIEVTLVGDVDMERAIDAVARSFGALPSRPLRQPPDNRAGAVHFPPPTPTPVIITHGGRPDQAVAMAAWPTDDFYANVQSQRTLAMMAAILQSRLTDRLRVHDGVTYSPSASTDASDIFKGFGLVQAMVETPVDKVGRFYSELDSIVEALRTSPPSPDELDRAKRPRVDQRIRLLRENQYWITALANAQHDDRHFDAIRALVPGTEQVTAADIQAAAVKYLRPNTSFHLTVMPRGTGG
jgi:zinc protease